MASFIRKGDLVLEPACGPISFTGKDIIEKLLNTFESIIFDILEKISETDRQVIINTTQRVFKFSIELTKMSMIKISPYQILLQSKWCETSLHHQV